jgi:hypothetical protein
MSGSLSAEIYGDTSGSLGDRIRAGDQALAPDPSVDYLLLRIVGDADVLFDRAEGGDDSTRFGRATTIELIGDARLLADRATGGDDRLGIGMDGGFNTIYGDGQEMTGRAQGGDDELFAFSRSGARVASTNDVYGDAETLRERSSGGDDRLVDVDFPFSNARHLWRW